ADLGWHAVAPDHRGHGASSKPEGTDNYSFSILAEDSKALVGALGWDRYVLLGHSMGGFVAQLIATSDPARLFGLILMDTGHGPIQGVNAEEAMLAGQIAIDAGIDELARILAERESPLETAANRRLLEERPGYAEFGDRKFRATSPYLYAALLSELVAG